MTGQDEQIRITRAQFPASPLKQELVIKPPNDAGYVAIIEPSNCGEILLYPPAPWVEQ